MSDPGSRLLTGAGATISLLPTPERGTLSSSPSKIVSLIGATNTPSKVGSIDKDTRALAATCYGEGSTDNNFQEMAAIANVLVRQQKARGYKSVSSFIKADKTFAFAAHDGNQRYKQLDKATEKQLDADLGMTDAIRAARNALSAKPVDYSNGAFFWDGADIKSNYANHAKVSAGIRFTDPTHNIYEIESKDVPGEAWWKDAKGKKTKVRGTWDYKYESTAAWGGTIFWKYNSEFLNATGNKEHK